MKRVRKFLAQVLYAIAVLQQLFLLVASLLMLGAVLLVVWLLSVPDTFAEAYHAIRGDR